MKYMGSKNRIAKYILPIILKNRKPEQWYVEPFVGGANIIDKVDGKRIGADSNKYLIALLNEMQKNGFDAPLVDEKRFLDVKKNKSNYPNWFVGFVGFQLSYGAIWFGSYRRDSINKRDYAMEAKKNINKQSFKIKGVVFKNCNYQALIIPNNSIIYCDPPYQGTAKYKDEIKHTEFWQWCRNKVKEGHKVFISEYTAPEDFKCIWSKEIVSSLAKNTGSKKGIEKLWIKK